MFINKWDIYIIMNLGWIFLYGLVLPLGLLLLIYLEFGHDIGYVIQFLPVVVVFSISASPIVYFWKKYDDEKRGRKRASENIYTELADTKNALDDPDNHREAKFGEKTYFFANIMFNHDFYDSLIFSGKINFLPTALQQQTQDVFQKTKDHNLYIQKIRDFEDSFATEEQVWSKLERYYKGLEACERDLVRDIPRIKEALSAEFKMP